MEWQPYVNSCAAPGRLIFRRKTLVDELLEFKPDAFARPINGQDFSDLSTDVEPDASLKLADRSEDCDLKLNANKNVLFELVKAEGLSGFEPPREIKTGAFISVPAPINHNGEIIPALT